MRINDPNALGRLSSAPSGRTGETEAINPSVKDGSTSAGRAAGDRLELSTFTGRLSQTLATDSAGRAQRVGQLKAAVQSGAYRPDPAAIGRSIIGYSLEAGKK